MDEPELLRVPVVEPVVPQVNQQSGLQVAKTVRDIRRGKALSQRQLANRMQVPRTYISKIENGKAMPTLSSLQRLATALEVDICALVQDARSRKQQEAEAVMADPFLAEVSLYVAQMDPYQRSMLLNQTRDMAMGRRRTA
jgi:transcriptional regulator with XRE-family HTH domain